MFGGNTITELANNMGVSSKELNHTIERFNSHVQNKDDLDFRQASHMLVNKIETPPYWATIISMTRHYTCGGLRVGGKNWTQVLDRWGKIIPGYYAAGEVTGGFHGTNRLGCNAILECIVAGRWAGLTSAEFK
jgi:succinate dehydrogenase/fumarate reductase flavoprotein subunit